ncbi:AarF/ABC1/UbiB kinase family protein [Halioglobus maricola]|uniref:AarF/ABC1/UbiB kinase family protein n=1 Tax=Halioglobus maricola TaxID=2601894 RepID=A0A5P9NJL1_9GAMM|nr:AarF/UbiB family protein [Halioglobus maricola]QFU75957.1 AarF/ABC1/UbiB kinase family protein [Halioglobus maricola]
MPKTAAAAPADPQPRLEEWLPIIRDRTGTAMRATGAFAGGLAKIYVAMRPLATLINRHADVTEPELNEALDALFVALRRHPVTEQIRDVTKKLREDNILPNEESTENLIRFLMDQVTARSVIPIPEQVTEEFWSFFNDLMAEPELQGLGEVSLDVARIVLGAYEPLIVDVLNQIKAMRRSNNHHMRELYDQTGVLRSDLDVFRRQVGALAYIREFFDTDPEDFKAQAGVVAQMVREFGPFFIKMAQVAASGSDFLPEEISSALEVFQEDVEPMAPWEVEQAFKECFGESPSKRYYDFDASKPLKSGSIASVYVAQKPVLNRRGKQELQTLVVKVGRHNLEREFLIGKTVIKLAILSSQYWAPHSKLSPFLSSWLDQVDVFVEGFRAELDFEAESAVQTRFGERARYTGGWHVPEVYATTRRIIEMEYIETGASLGTAFRPLQGRKNLRSRRKVGRAFLHTLLSHLLVYQEFHGDLHQGNLLVDERNELYFIDWGNSVDVSNIWRPALNYLQAIFAADAHAITSAMIKLGIEPAALEAQRSEILRLVEQALSEAAIAPLGLDFALTIYREGSEGLIKRLELAMGLASVMARQGIVINSEYMHLSRSVTAMLGSYVGIYKGVSRLAMSQDIAKVMLEFPAIESYRQASGYRKRLLRQVAADLPVGRKARP